MEMSKQNEENKIDGLAECAKNIPILKNSNTYQRPMPEVWVIVQNDLVASVRNLKTALFLSTIRNTHDGDFNATTFAYLERLINEGADINAHELPHGLTPLEIARALEHKGLESFLLSRGAQEEECAVWECLLMCRFIG